MFSFDTVSTEWSHQQQILASDGVADDYFGISVSVFDDMAIVGAYHAADTGKN